MEQSLSNLRPCLTSELVSGVLHVCNLRGLDSLRFFLWVCSHPSYSPAAVEFEVLICTLARTRYWEKMWVVIDKMRSKDHNLNLDPGVVSFVIEEYGKASLIDQAVMAFNKCNDLRCPQTTGIYNSLLFVLCGVKNFHGAYALIRRMLRKGEVPDKRTYSIVVNAWCLGGKTKEPQEFLEEMSRKGFDLPVQGRELLVEGLLNGGHVEAAQQMTRRMMKEASLPHIGMFNSLLEAVFNLGDIDLGVDLFHVAYKLGLCVDIVTYRLMIQAVSKAGMIDEAFRLLHSSIEDGIKPLPSLYGPTIEGLCMKGHFDDAFRLFSDMKVKGHPPNRPVYTMLITLCARGGRFVEAANYLVEMAESNMMPMRRCLDMVTEGLKNCGKHDLAKRIEQLEVSRGVV